jgi:hypothetical protein
MRRLIAASLIFTIPLAARAEHIWLEGEKPAKSSVTRHPWWYDQVKKDLLSGGDFISHWDDKKPGEVEYTFTAKIAGEYDLWARVNPVQVALSYKLNTGEWKAVPLKNNAADSVNIAGDGKIDLRFLAWVRVGKVALKAGDNAVSFKLESKNHNHGMLDCFVFTSEPFTPRGIRKPGGDIAKINEQTDMGWFAFAPEADTFKPGSAIDLRWLNEQFAGEKGRIQVKGSDFIHETTGEPVRFWAVNGPPGHDRDSLKRQAKLLAKYGVNLARIHHGYYDDKGTLDPKKLAEAHEAVAALKAEGIYTHFSIYFPLWLRPAPETKWLPGYDGKKHPFASLYFNKDFQSQYREWWKALLLTPHAETGKKLIDDPAVMGVEIINEDSYFFWTFNDKAVPDEELRIVEKQFGDWLATKYGTLGAALKAWHGQKSPRDNIAEGRMGFRPLWNMSNERTARDKDTARFLYESQRSFYEDTTQILRGLGFKGLITCSNWVTADPKILGPIEKMTYLPGDFIDRHGYFGGMHKGDASEWSIRDGHTFTDRSGLRFDGDSPGKPRAFVHPGMDPNYDGKPSMISETTWTRPNRYRTEAPLYFAAYGALQGTDAVVHFAMDGDSWSVKPGFFMQPWTLMAPSQIGQFPATALLFRKGLVKPGEVLVDLDLKIDDVLDLKGTPLPQGASFDELRLKDVPKGVSLQPGSIIDPLVHYAGRTNVNFTKSGGRAMLVDLSKLIDRSKRTVTSSTGELRLDYGSGVLTIDAPSVQGVSGNLKAAGKSSLKDVAVSSDLDLAHIVAVSLDGLPLATSKKILLQAMSEEKATGFRTTTDDKGIHRIIDIGRDPWLVKELSGTVRFNRPDAEKLKVTALDHNGYPTRQLGDAAAISLDPRTVYYLISP